MPLIQKIEYILGRFEFKKSWSSQLLRKGLDKLFPQHGNLVTNFFLITPDLKPSSNITVENATIPKYREKLMKLKQFDFYKERRDNLFDFAMIGEQENIPIF